jgi:hypothetical protein
MAVCRKDSTGGGLQIMVWVEMHQICLSDVDLQSVIVANLECLRVVDGYIRCLPETDSRQTAVDPKPPVADGRFREGQRRKSTSVFALTKPNSISSP